MANKTITIPEADLRRLREAGLRYGYSADEIARRVITDATRKLLSIPEESLDDYDNPDEMKASLNRALADVKKGNISQTL